MRGSTIPAIRYCNYYDYLSLALFYSYDEESYSLTYSTSNQYGYSITQQKLPKSNKQI